MKDNKILVEQYRDTSYFTLPGGYVEIGEDSSSAIIREIKEEVGVNFKIDRYLGIVENFFINANQEKTHGIDFYYLGTTEDEIPLENFDLIENDNGIIINHHFKWIELQKLTDYDIRPKCIIPYLRNEQNTSFHLVQERQTNFYIFLKSTKNLTKYYIYAKICSNLHGVVVVKRGKQL